MKLVEISKETLLVEGPPNNEAGVLTRCPGLTNLDGEMRYEASVDTLPCNVNKALVVDDEKAITRVFSLILGQRIPGIEIGTADDGETALRAFSGGHHAVIVMDLHMPGMDGETAFLEMTALCERRHWDMPAVVFCSGFFPSTPVVDAVRGNPNHCLLRKPVHSDIIVRAVLNRLVRMRRD